MQWSKFSLLLVLLFNFSVFAEERFTSVQCLNSDFETSVQNEGKFFGLVKNDLFIVKNKCLIKVTFKGILETVWTVDICREPIHMRVKSKGSQNVYKRKAKCDKDDKSDYCYFRNELVLNLQDQGLIFAKGLKEKLSDAHGQVYCSYLLLKKYLDDGKMFSQFDKEVNLYKSEASCDIPKTEPQDKTQQPAEGSLREELKSNDTIQSKEVEKVIAPKSNDSGADVKPRF